jgi:FkbM family methyltransferase
MTFISYSQNFEDIMLWRALKHVEKGFYVDVGAGWPEIDSVTKAFYDRGWRGINVDPNPAYHDQLRANRPEDVNLCVAVSDAPGTTEINIVNEPGLSTLDATIAKEHESKGWKVSRIPATLLTLETIWTQYVGRRDVHFLKVDVEGFEQQVLSGKVWSGYRPWIVVVEAVRPTSRAESHKSWEPILLRADYSFAYADGLNRFYVAQEHSELIPSFTYPPNVFDDFILHGHYESVLSRLNAAEVRARNAESQLKAVFQSSSWRMTRPLRWVRTLLRPALHK